MKPGDTLEIINGTATRLVSISDLSRGHVSVYWPVAGFYDVDLDNGYLMAEVLPRRGVYRVNSATGRVEGTHCRLRAEDLVKLLRPGDELFLEHDFSRDPVHAEVRGSSMDGVLQLLVSQHGGKQLGRNHRTPWRVETEALRDLRRCAGIRARLAG